MTITTLSEYLEVVKESFQRWLDTHTDSEKWAEEWFLGYTDLGEWLRECTREGVISNDFFSVDVAHEALKLWSEDHAHLFGKCPCGRIWENGYEDCEDCKYDEEGEGVEYETEEVSAEEISDFQSGLINDSEQVSYINGIDWYIEKAMEGPAFETYREALSYITTPIEEEAQSVLDAIENATSQAELLAALAWANHVEHANGSILEDYGQVDDWLINQISQDGIGNVLELDWENTDFPEEELELCQA